MIEGGEPALALAQTTSSEITHEHLTGPITRVPSTTLELPEQTMSAASLDRRNAKLKTTLDEKTPRYWDRERRTGGIG